jgi:hypothetical protein
VAAFVDLDNLVAHGDVGTLAVTSMKAAGIVESSLVAIQEGRDMNLVGCHLRDSTMPFKAVSADKVAHEMNQTDCHLQQKVAKHPCWILDVQSNQW